MVVSSDVIGHWLDECLENRFADFGFVLQDTVNEVGRRLGFHVTHGVYRSHSKEGYDGLWRSSAWASTSSRVKEFNCVQH